MGGFSSKHFGVILVNNFKICRGAAFTKQAMNINPSSARLTESETDELTCLAWITLTYILFWAAAIEFTTIF